MTTTHKCPSIPASKFLEGTLHLTQFKAGVAVAKVWVEKRRVLHNGPPNFLRQVSMYTWKWNIKTGLKMKGTPETHQAMEGRGFSPGFPVNNGRVLAARTKGGRLKPGLNYESSLFS